MSEAAKKEKSPIDLAERRKLREERRAIAKAEVKRMQAEQTEEIEDLIDEKGLDPTEVVILPTDKGVLAVKKATAHEMSRFMRDVNNSAQPGKRKKKVDLEESNKALVRSSRLYPDDKIEFESILETYPVCWSTLGDGLVDLAGASFEADVRKN